MQIISLNGNGIRACVRKGLIPWWQSTEADVLLFQEVRFDDFNVINDLFPGYWTAGFSAVKKGYSGVLAIAKTPPKKVNFGIGDPLWDDEARVMHIVYSDLVIVNAYLPSGASSLARQKYKLEFLIAFKHYIDELSQNHSNIIIAGDWNMCHKEIDIHNPLRLSGTPGFTQEERQWLDVLYAEGWRDGFRIFNSESENYTWWSYQSNSRSRNVGWRIDAFWLSPKASQGAKRCIHLYKPELSDHCPVLLDWEMPSIFT